jgi:hypothetical protein
MKGTPMTVKLMKYGELASLPIGRGKQYPLCDYWKINGARQRIQKKTGLKFAMRKTDKMVRVIRTA